MRIRLNPSALRKTQFHEYAIRFLLGGLITALAGLIAKLAGPVFGGLFLAFPAILPASATLIEKHQRLKKERKGLEGTQRGRQAAGVDAYGAALGSIGLIAFALWIWRFLPHQATALTLGIATILWFVVSVLLWQSRKLVHSRLLRIHSGAALDER
jgi:Protein of unknown function (DUF3147)